MKNSDYMAIWNRLKQPPSEALKKISGGRLNNMTDISPQWRYMALTEEFGPCGVGWKFEIVKLWMDQGAKNQIVAWASVLLYVNVDGSWCDPVPGIGGSMFIADEKKGLRTSDEAYKMAVTDAIGTAAKMIGLAANVYLNNMDGSKYRSPEPKPQTHKPELTPSIVKKWGNAIAAYKRDGNFNKIEAVMVISAANKQAIKDAANGNN